MDSSRQVVTAEDTLEVSTGNNEVYAALHVGCFGTAIGKVHVVDATQNQCHVAILLRLVAGTVNLLDVAYGTEVLTSIVCGFGHGQRCAATYVTLGIATAKDVMDVTADELRHSLSSAVLRNTIIVSTNIGTRVVSALTVTTAEYVVDDVGAQDGHIRCGHGSCIAAAIDIFYAGMIATLDNHLGTGSLHLVGIACVISFGFSV